MIKPLKETFGKNGLPYKLIKRNELVALYGVGGTYTKNTLHYEVCKIQIRDDKYGLREALPSNEQFGTEGSRAILKHEEAMKYFDTLTYDLQSKEKSEK